MIANKSKKNCKRSLLVAALGGAALLIIIAFTITRYVHKSYRPAANDIFAKASSGQEIKTGLPVRLIIPKIKVNASVEEMGLTPAGEMDVPNNVVNVGWYKHGTIPGNLGSSVIDGHLDGPKGEAGVFANLSKLSKGDTVSIMNDKGETISFIVRISKIYNQSDHPDEVFNSTDASHLNLITCTGAWDKNINRFSKRLVVFTDKVN